MISTSDDAIPVFGRKLEAVTYIDRPGAYGLLFNEAGHLAVVQTSHGFFLPGGGIEPGESDEMGLRRELEEEIGHQLIRAVFILKAVQYHWSEFYQKHFRKIGSFYHIKTQTRSQEHVQSGHTLHWIERHRAATGLSQEFQRWAVSQIRDP